MSTHPAQTNPDTGPDRLTPGIRTTVLIAAWIITAIITAVWLTSLAAYGRAENVRVFVAITILAAVTVTAWWSTRRAQDRMHQRLVELAALITRSEVRMAEQLDNTRDALVTRLDLLESQRPDYSDGYERGRAAEARLQNEQRGALQEDLAPPNLHVVRGNSNNPWRR